MRREEMKIHHNASDLSEQQQDSSSFRGQGVFILDRTARQSCLSRLLGRHAVALYGGTTRAEGRDR